MANQRHHKHHIWKGWKIIGNVEMNLFYEPFALEEEESFG